jgi:ribonucleoside-diphosphate reductase alpha chain
MRGYTGRRQRIHHHQVPDVMRPFAQAVWASRYRYSRDGTIVDADLESTFTRVAQALASIESDPATWSRRYARLMTDLRFLPGGRVLAGAGTDRQVTLFNCFVSGPLRDSISGILDSLKETAVTMQQGGGVGVDFSGLRPHGSIARKTGAQASGPVSFMRIWDALCETLLATSSRRGAMIGTLRCDHPDILEFVDAKRTPGMLRNFNLSVLITDDFMTAVRDDAQWALAYPAGGTVHRRLAARALWQRIVDAAHATGEPGLLFIDTINRENNLYYCERISATNPCGEVPLPPYGACDLGSVNLAALVEAPFTTQARLDTSVLRETVGVAVRLLDAVIDVSAFPLPQQADKARAGRRIGLGLTGLADALIMLGLHYGSRAGRDFAAGTVRQIRDTAYATSIDLAREKGAFPLFDRARYLAAPFVGRLPATIRDAIAAHGIRNSHLLAIAPAGSISLLAGNVSSGVEPVYALEAERALRGSDRQVEHFHARDYAYDLWSGSGSVAPGRQLPDVFVTADQLPARAHLDMQACLQPFIDGAISKTVNLPAAATSADVADAFRYAWSSAIKGCTVYRQGSRGGQVIRACTDIDCDEP